MINFCTLFDSYYLDKGIALYKSLERVSNDFMLFIFCFDERSYDILNDLSYDKATVLHCSCFETQELLEKKRERSKAEYCWTCTPVTIEYVLDNYDVQSCTYLDADEYFYCDPQVLFNEINSARADSVIVEHRFKNNPYGRKLEERNGKYCVEFNYFNQTKNSRIILKWWKEQCFDWCYDQPEPDRMGDQKYLNSFPVLFDGVHVLQNLGGGVAPWNLEQYHLIKQDGTEIFMRDQNNNEFRLVFYHFQNIRYMPGRKVNIKSQTKNKKLKYSIYIPYLIEIEKIRNMLKKEYGITYEIKGIVRSSNPIVGFLQKHFAALKIQSISDVLDLDKLEEYKY